MNTSKTVVMRLLAVYVASAILISQQSWGADISQGIGMALAVAFAICYFKGTVQLRAPTELIMVSVFFTYTLLGGFFAKDAGSYIRLEFTLFQLVILVTIVVSLVDSVRDVREVLKAFVLASLLAAALTVAGVGSGSGTRIGGLLVNPNLYGLTLLLGTVAAIGLAVLSETGRQKLLCVAPAFLFAYQIILTQSRKAILGLIILPVVFYLLYAYRRLFQTPVRTAAIGFVLVLVMAFLALVVAQTPAYDRLASAYDAVVSGDVVGADEGSLRQRVAFYRAAFAMWQDNPLFGVGTAQFAEYTSEYVAGLRSTYAHSNYMEILANFGLIGFLLYYTVYGVIFLRLMRGRSRTGNAAHRMVLDVFLSFMILLVVLEFAWVTYLEKVVWIFLGTAIAGARVFGKGGDKVVPDET